ncbi:hypothetical protein YDC107_5414 [Escherichia phage YDC107_1]|nr:hypothetical protein YDC107_5409 [Escherichia phage YDC107_1]AUO37531.1 hypothetical protein YDC107_5414 [Escherichia phage YDC107_1]
MMPFLVRGSLAVWAVMSVVAAAFPPLLLPFAGGRRGRPHNKAPINSVPLTYALAEICQPC